jgi:hypothetical protein
MASSDTRLSLRAFARIGLLITAGVFLLAGCQGEEPSSVTAATTTTSFDVEAAVAAYLATTTSTAPPTTTTTQPPTTTTTRPKPTTTTTGFSIDSAMADYGFCHWTSTGSGVHWSELSSKADCHNLDGFTARWSAAPKGFWSASGDAMTRMLPDDYSTGAGSSSCYVPGTYIPGTYVGGTYVPGVSVPGVWAC